LLALFTVRHIISINAHEEVCMKEDIKFWIEQIVTSILFFGLMALLYVIMVLVFPDPTLWR
jgi:hypothetical protein